MRYSNFLMAAAFALLASSCHDGGKRGVGTEPMAQIEVEKHAEILSLPIEVKAKRVNHSGWIAL